MGHNVLFTLEFRAKYIYSELMIVLPHSKTPKKHHAFVYIFLSSHECVYLSWPDNQQYPIHNEDRS